VEMGLKQIKFAFSLQLLSFLAFVLLSYCSQVTLQGISYAL
jgi:hypothetical protein